MKRIRRTFAMAIVLVSGTYADIAPEPIYSEGIKPRGETKVQMVNELVIVDVYKNYAIVTAEFNMLNRGEDATIEVGFPNGGRSLYSYSMLTDFSVTIDGESYEYENKSNAIRPKGMVRMTEEIMTADYQEWLVWDVTFNKAERKKIVVQYKQPAGLVYSTGLLDERYFHYILETGAGWYDDIEEATVVVNLKDGLTPEHILSTSPTNDMFSGDVLTWNFENLEPSRTDNIFINYNQIENYSEYVELHKKYYLYPDAFIDNPRNVWEMVYACNRAGEYELAEKILEAKIRAPRDTDKDENAPKFTDLNLKKYEQMFMHKQLVMARYQLYLKNKSEMNEKRLREALDGLKAWAVFEASDPEKIEGIFPDGDYEEASHQWLMTEYLMNDYGVASWKRSDAFSYFWREKVDELLMTEYLMNDHGVASRKRSGALSYFWREKVDELLNKNLWRHIVAALGVLGILLLILGVWILNKKNP